MTNGVWSPKLNRFIGFALVHIAAKPGTRATLVRGPDNLDGTLHPLPFV